MSVRFVNVGAVVVLATALVAVFALAQDSGRSGEGACRHINLKGESKPGWTISGTWRTPEELILVDALNNALLRYSPTGFLGVEDGHISSAVKSRVGRFHPTRILAQGPSEVWVELTGGEMVQVNETLQQVSVDTLNLLRLEAPGRRVIGSVFDWTIAHRDLVGFGNIKEASEEWSTAFYRVDLSPPHRTEILKELGRRPPEKAWYRLGLNLMTSIEGTAYALGFNDRIVLYRANSGDERLLPVLRFTGEFRNPPTLLDFMTPEEFVRTMEIVQESVIPIGIHGWHDSLYIPWHKHDSKSGGLEWFLTELDPLGKRVKRTVGLPTTSSHLTVVPGPSYWAFVEKGQVRGFGLQEVSSIRTIPSSAIASAQHGSMLCE